jgi:hypothetical protein
MRLTVTITDADGRELRKVALRMPDGYDAASSACQVALVLEDNFFLEPGAWDHETANKTGRVAKR